MAELEQAVLCVYNQALDSGTRHRANQYLDQARSISTPTPNDCASVLMPPFVTARGRRCAPVCGAYHLAPKPARAHDHAQVHARARARGRADPHGRGKATSGQLQGQGQGLDQVEGQGKTLWYGHGVLLYLGYRPLARPLHWVGAGGSGSKG